jgi:hypothetical protein
MTRTILLLRKPVFERFKYISSVPLHKIEELRADVGIMEVAQKCQFISTKNQRNLLHS